MTKNTEFTKKQVTLTVNIHVETLIHKKNGTSPDRHGFKKKEFYLKAKTDKQTNKQNAYLFNHGYFEISQEGIL